MADIKKVAPSIQGRTLGAAISGGRPGMPDSTGTLGRALSGFAEDVRRAGAMITRMQGEAENLALEKAQADYLSEVSGAFDKEVFALKGASLVGAEDTARRILAGAEDRQLEKLSQYGAGVSEKFRIFTTRNGTGYLSRAAHYAQGELRRASGDAMRRTYESSVRNFAAAGRDADLEEGLQTASRLYVLENGRVMDDAKMGLFEEGLAKGEVWFRGERLKVVDQISPGDKGVISRSAAEDLRARLKVENQMYTQRMQSTYDTMCAVRVDKLLKAGDVESAEVFLSQRGDRLSGGARGVLQSQVSEVRRQAEVRVEASNWAQQKVLHYAATDPLSAGGTLYSAGFDALLQKDLAEQARLAAGDTTGLQERKLHAMRQQYQMLMAQQRQQVLAENERVQRELNGDNGDGADGSPVNYMAPGNGSALLNKLRTMPVTRVTQELYRHALTREVQNTEKLLNSPEGRRLRESKILEFERRLSEGGKLEIRTGEGTTEGEVLYSFDLGTEKGLREAMNYYGFTPREQLRIRGSADGSRPRALVTDLLVDILNEHNGVEPEDTRKMTPAAINVLAPELVNRMSRMLRYDAATADKVQRGTLKESERKELRQRLRSLLQSYTAEKPGWLWDSTVHLPDWLFEGVREDGTVDTRRSYGAFWRLGMTDDQVRKVEAAAQAYRLEVRPAGEEETAEDLVRSRRSPGTEGLSESLNIHGRERDPESGYNYPGDRMEEIRKERVHKKERMRALREKNLKNRAIWAAPGAPGGKW